MGVINWLVLDGEFGYLNQTPTSTTLRGRLMPSYVRGVFFPSVFHGVGISRFVLSI